MTSDTPKIRGAIWEDYGNRGGDIHYSPRSLSRVYSPPPAGGGHGPLGQPPKVVPMAPMAGLQTDIAGLQLLVPVGIPSYPWAPPGRGGRIRSPRRPV